jgi:hypothetical protein
MILRRLLLVFGMLTLLSCRMFLPQGTITPSIEVTLTPSPQPTVTSTPLCETHTADLLIEASSQQVRVGETVKIAETVKIGETIKISETIKIGETIKITGILHNSGCLMLGLPKYSLIYPRQEKSLFDPPLPEPILHSLGVAPGESDQVVFSLQAVSSGVITLILSATFEVHQGYPGPAYWGQASSKELQIEVLP